MFKKLVLSAAFLTFIVVVVGAYVRLQDAGLGCPDWPGCYGHYVGVPQTVDEIARAMNPKHIDAHGMSAHYSGAGFSDMRFPTLSVDAAGFDQWVAKTKAGVKMKGYRGKPALHEPSAVKALVGLSNLMADAGNRIASIDVTNGGFHSVGGSNNATRLLNAKKATGNGAELNLEALITPDFLVTFGGSLNNTKIKDAALGVPPGGSLNVAPFGQPGVFPTVRDPMVGGNALVDGAILANGTPEGSICGGAGGSVYLAAGTLSGQGAIRANGPAGGGGVTKSAREVIAIASTPARTAGAVGSAGNLAIGKEAAG